MNECNNPLRTDTVDILFNYLSFIRLRKELSLKIKNFLHNGKLYLGNFKKNSRIYIYIYFKLYQNYLENPIS